MTEVLREASDRLGIPVRKLAVAVDAARLKTDAFGVVETLVRLNRDEPDEERLGSASRAICDALDRMVSPDEDPLAGMDEASEEEVLLGQMEAEMERRELRRRILASCIGVEQAARLAERTRQRLERLRREGRLLALRVSNRWRYPRWQFAPDHPGGVLPGLGEVLAHLQLSPAGSAAWLTTIHEDLGGRAPVDLLVAGRTREVIDLAEEHGHMP